MEKILDLISEELQEAFAAVGYDKKYGKASISNRPDLCEYQCNGAMAAAKEYKKAPFIIAEAIAGRMQENEMFSFIEAVNPGFINIKLKECFLAGYLQKMLSDDRLGCEKAKQEKTIIVDYGGANVAKPLHIGHLRSAIIGESVKRISRFMGHNVIGDVHLGDWGLQMGLVITELKKRQPDLVYFKPDFEGDYPVESPVTITELEEIYPIASAYSKENPEYREEALEITMLLQKGHRGYLALWQHILNVSMKDLKKNYDRLGVTFDLWKKESDAQPFIQDMVKEMKDKGYAYIDDGALVVDVKEDSDQKEIPPCMILKSDGASLYNTTDLATIVERMKLFSPDEIIYLTDKRQDLYFEQVFRCARKTKLVQPQTELKFLGFGTMNGKDGKPFKTRDGGVMRLENLLNSITKEMYDKMNENDNIPKEEVQETARLIALAALKYGDLSNQAAKDYIFDEERFTSFEGDTGPYLLYTIVRIKSILKRYAEEGGNINTAAIKPAYGELEKRLMLELAKLNSVVENSFEELAPHKICAFLYDLANAFNRFYHDNKIMAEEDKEKKTSWIALLGLTEKVLVCCIDLLGFSSPDRM